MPNGAMILIYQKMFLFYPLLAFVYKICKGSSVELSDTGVVTPYYFVTYGDPSDRYEMRKGDTEIIAKTALHTYKFIIHAYNYSHIYCDKVIDEYISKNVSDSMSDDELIDVIAKFPARYDYSRTYSGLETMLVFGCGDCVLSTCTIVALCEKLGIKAWMRDASKDAGAGSTHVNAMVELNGKYYQIEAGYEVKKTNGFRMYTIEKRSTLFSYMYYGDELNIYQYDGYHDEGTLIIPDTIDGHKVTGICDAAITKREFSEIILPDTLQSIGNFAFSTCESITSIKIPASVTSIGKSTFVNCTKLKNIEIDENNPNYKVVDQAIYSKDGTVLISSPMAASISIPPTVKKIEDYAFYYNKNMTSIAIPENIETLGEGVFGNCENLTDISFEGQNVKEIEAHCFDSNFSLSVIRLPSSVNKLCAYAFANCRRLQYIYFNGNAPSFGADIEGTYEDAVFDKCTTNICYLPNDTTWTKDIMVNHGGTITWLPYQKGKIEKLTSAEVSLDKESYAYTGENIVPQTTVILNGKELIKNTDYIVNCNNNKNLGTGTVEIVGINSYEGQITKKFIISKAKRGAELYLAKQKIVEHETTKTIIMFATVENVKYTITAIANNAFENNKSIKKLVIGNNVTKIGNNAFSKCSKLTSVTIGKKVTTIGKGTFKDCKKCKTIKIQSTKLKSVGKNAIKGINKKAVIKVPKKKLKKYKQLFNSKSGYKKSMKIIAG